MIENKNKISIHQLQIIIFFNIVGGSLLALPKEISKSSSESFIFAILLGIFISLFSTFLIVYSLKLNKENDFYSTINKVLGVFLSKIICFLFLLKILLSLTFTMKMFLKMTSDILLPKTNSLLISIIFLSLAIYLCFKGKNNLAKTLQLFFYLIILFIFIFLICSLFQIDTKNIPNLLNPNLTNIQKGSIVTFFSFSSISYIFLDYSYVENKKDIIKNSIYVVFFVGVIILLVTTISIFTFTLKGVLFLDYPSFDTLNKITKNDAITIDFLIFAFFAFVSSALFYAGTVTNYIIPTKNKKIYIISSALLVLLLMQIDIDLSSTLIIDTTLSIIFMIVLPIILIVYGLFKNNIKKQKLKKIASSISFLIPLLFISSCADKIEIEDRRFIYEMSVDKEGDLFVLTYGYLSPSENQDNTIVVHTEKATTLQNCLDKAYDYNENTLNFMQVKTIVLSTDVIKDNKMLKDIFYVLSNTNQINKDVSIVAFDGDTKTLLNEDITKKKSVSYFLTKFYKNNKNVYRSSINNSLDYILLKIRNNESVIISKISNSDNLYVDGATIFTNFNFNMNMNSHILEGYSLLEGDASSVPVDFLYNNDTVYIKVTDSSRKVNFIEDDNKLTVKYDIDVNAKILDYIYFTNKIPPETLKDLNKFTNEHLQLIVYKTYSSFVKNNVDALYLKQKLEKENYKLYKKYALNNKNFLNELNFVININTNLIY